MKKNIFIALTFLSGSFLFSNLEDRLSTHKNQIDQIRTNLKSGNFHTGTPKTGCGCGNTSNCNS